MQIALHHAGLFVMSWLRPHLLLLVLATAACSNAGTWGEQGRSGSAVGTSPGQLAPSDLQSQYHIFDPNYNYTQNPSVNPASLAQRFPIQFNNSQAAVVPAGGPMFALRTQMILNARISLRLQYFIFKADESGSIIKDLLIAAVKRGVRVQVIVDPLINGVPNAQKLYQELTSNGVNVVGYQPGYLIFLNGILNGGSNGNVFQEANMRYHEKYLISDAEDPVNGMALTGGVNLSNEYYRVDVEHPVNMWHDRDIAVKGAVVADLTRTFDENFVEVMNRIQSKSSNGFDGSILASFMNLNPLGSQSSLNPLLISRLQAASMQPTHLNWQVADMRFIRSRPRFSEDFIAPAYIDMINASTTTVDVVNAYFLPDGEIINALTNAVRRGVKVRIFTNSLAALASEHDDKILSVTMRSQYASMLIANQSATSGGSIAIFEAGADKNLRNGEGELHAKYAVFDNAIAIVGSYNLDNRSRKLNTEGVIVLANTIVANDLTNEANTFADPRYGMPISWEQAVSFQQPSGFFEQSILKMNSFLFAYL